MHGTITLESVSQQFSMANQEITLFSNLSLQLTNDQSTAIIGPSGVGKSSLLLLMAGLERPSQGHFGFSLQGKNASSDTLRKHSGFVFQQFHLLSELDALNNLALPLKLKGDGQAVEKARYWLDKVGLSARENHKPEQLSGGEQQRIAIARAFITEPLFVFADEPTGNLDQNTALGITSLMFECAQKNQSGLIFVTHNSQFASQADRCFTLSKSGLTERTDGRSL